MIRELIERFLDPLKAEEGQIVVYGAGFDTNYFRLQQKQATFRSYYEIDFHSVVSAKSRVIQRVSALSALLSDMVVLRIIPLILSSHDLILSSKYWNHQSSIPFTCC